MGSVLSLRGVNQFYGQSHTLWDVSFDVDEGACLCLMGRNGVGKTTTLRCIMGLQRIRDGEFLSRGEPIAREPAESPATRGIGYVPQGREIFPRLTVEENLLMGLATKPGSTPIPSRIFDMFPVLKQMMHRRGGDLSGGQQQQLAIGRALAMGPKLLILDEPTEGIQPSIIKDIERAIRMLAATGEMAILLVEQYYDFAESLADQYLLMERGEFIMRGRGETMPQDGVREALAV
mgnify:CR=1 FL=1